MDLDKLEKLIASLPFVKAIAPFAGWITGLMTLFFIIALVVNFGYYIVHLDRDDMYIAKPIKNTPFSVTLPEKTYHSDKDYTVLISTPAITKTTIVTVTNASGV